MPNDRGGGGVAQGNQPLGRQAWWLLAVSGIFALSVGLSNTFVNVYLWKVDRNYGAIGQYNLLVYCALPVAFVAAGWLAKRLHTLWTMRIGIVWHAIFYAVALLGGTSVARLPWLLGVIMGLAGGMYWFSFNVISLQVTRQGRRDRFYGLNGVAGAVAGMLAPLVAGFLIAQGDGRGGLSGYHLIFALSLVLFVVATLVSWCLKAHPEGGQLRLGRAWAGLRRRPWRMLLTGCFVYGLREGVFLFLIGLLMYIATGSELRLGEFLLLQGAISFVSFYLVGRFLRPGNRLTVLGIGAACMAGAATLFTMPVDARLLLWYGSLIALTIPLFLVPLQGFIFDGITSLDPGGEDVMEHIIAREVFENVGRVLGIVAFLWLIAARPDARHISAFALGLGFVQIGTWILIKSGGGSAFTMRRPPQMMRREVHRPARIARAERTKKGRLG